MSKQNYSDLIKRVLMPLKKADYSYATEDDFLSKIDGFLNEREASVIKARYGLGECESQTFKVIAAKHGVSQSRVRDIVEISIRRIREPRNWIISKMW